MDKPNLRVSRIFYQEQTMNTAALKIFNKIPENTETNVHLINGRPFRQKG
jgi:hypothetical protein